MSFSSFLFFFLALPRPPRSTLFPYTTLFRSDELDEARIALVAQKPVDLATSVAVRCVHGRQRVPIDARTTKERQPAHHLVERSEEHTSELQSHSDLVCRLLLEKKNTTKTQTH